MWLHLWVKGACCASLDGKMSVQGFSSLCSRVPALPWVSVSVLWCWKSFLAGKELLIAAVKSWKLPTAAPGESAALEASLPPFTVVFVGAGGGPRQHSWAQQPQPVLAHSAKCWQQGLNFPSWPRAGLVQLRLHAVTPGVAQALGGSQATFLPLVMMSLHQPLEDNQVPTAAGRKRETGACGVEGMALGPGRCQGGSVYLLAALTPSYLVSV